MTKSRLTDLNNIRYVIEVADSGSFSAAARLFGVPPSLVSRRIARLEEEVGARLFQRTTRSLALTHAGQAFLGHARTAMQSFALAEELAGDSGGVLTGRVRLSGPAGAASALWATVSKFMVRHPAVRIEMEVADRYVDLVEERFDMSIRAAPERRSERLVGRRLLDAPRYLFASPGYIRSHGAPRTVSELKNHDCVILGPRADRATWQIHAGKRIQNVIVQGRIAVNEARLAAECATDGIGIAFLPLAVCASLVSAGYLRRVLPRADGGEIGLWLVYPNRHLSPTCRALAEFLVTDLPASFTARIGR